MLKNIRINFRSRNNEYINYHLEFYTYFGKITENEKLLNQLWCLKSIFTIQNKYVESFLKMKNEEYYTAWCLLEEIERIYNSLRSIYYTESDKFFINFIYNYTKKFQKFFPYYLFLSPELLVKKYSCNICGKTYTFKKNCEHEVGKLYYGRMCGKVIEDCEIISVSLVKNPVQKYSVLFLEDGDQYNYDLIKSHIANLDSPFHRWDLEICEKLESHSSFKDIDKKDNCPCGSRKSYENCCLKKEGVVRPHFKVNYEMVPSSGKFENYVKFKNGL